MSSQSRSSFVKLSLIFFLSYVISVSGESDNYIIFMDLELMPRAYVDHHGWYLAMLESASASSSRAKAGTSLRRSSLPNSKLIYSYTHAIQGFSAHLSPNELEAIKKSTGYISSVKDMPVKPDTTHSSQFLGLATDSGIWPASNYGQDVIIGLVDTGIWPESKSFGDDGMTEIPSRWKGECEVGTHFNASMCNKKLIGARYFNKALLKNDPNLTISMNSTRDTEGHGTHTSSTAAGNYAKDASFFGYAPGIAKGVAPRARVAMYKALWDEGGTSADLIAAIDQAISDGVDVLSLSLGLDVNALHLDPIAIATFAAVEKGIFVSTSAGNEGPIIATLHNGTPWTITVAAGDMNRDYGGLIVLGDGVHVKGASLFPGNSLSETPLVFMDKCNDSIALSKIAEKIVVCEDDDKGDRLSDMIDNIRIANVSGGIFITSISDIEFFIQIDRPGIFVDTKSGKIVKNYIKKGSGQAKAAMVFRQTLIGDDRPAPRVTSYSSRGPSPSCPHILKPDILAPGSLVLAAWPDNSPTTYVNSKPLYSNFNLLSGTSMSCPHIAGVGALLKAAQPGWSPAAIRSAIMTTSYLTDNTKSPIEDLGDNNKPATPLAIGAGHVSPNKALDPGLIYDATKEDYTNLLCALNYTAKQIQTITRSSSFDCSEPSLDLNYPSFIVLLGRNAINKTNEFHRTVTNVGPGASTYTASVAHVAGFKVNVVPEKLVFKEKYEKLSYKLSVEGPATKMSNGQVAWGYLSWTDTEGKYEVRSPIVATPDPF